LAITQEHRSETEPLLKQQPSVQKKFYFAQLFGSGPLNWTKKESSQLKNADFLKIFRHAKYMITDLSSQLARKRIGRMGPVLAGAITSVEIETTPFVLTAGLPRRNIARTPGL
jgi:hypothetical protein